MRIHLIVNINRVVRYRKQVKRQKVEEPKPIEVDIVEEQEVEKILNKRKVIKYLVYWKKFTIENDIWEKEKDLENVKLVIKFKRRISTEIRQQERVKRNKNLKKL